MSPKEWRRVIMRTLFYAVLLALLVAVLFLGFATWRVFQKDREVKATYENREGELRKLEERKSELQADIESLGEERGIEAVVRERYPLARTGEEVIVIVDRNQIGEQEDVTTETSFWGKVKSYFSF